MTDRADEPVQKASDEVDLSRLRHDRYERLQSQLAAHDLPAVLLTDPVNIRYATSLSSMLLWSATNLMHYVLVPAEGQPVVFEYTEAMHVAEQLFLDVRPAHNWQYRFAVQDADAVVARFADEIAATMRDHRLELRLGVDALDPKGFFALAAAGVAVSDADQAVQAARRVKTHDEFLLLRRSAAVAEAALSDFEAAVQPGISEHALLARFWGRMLELGGEYCYSRAVASGERTNPWFQEASTRLVRPGDLVAIDTDMIGPHGYACDMSRTFLCGSTPRPGQKDAYRVAEEFIDGLAATLTPGMSCAELIHRAPRLPARFAIQRYPCMLHGIGMDDESPFVDIAGTTHVIPDITLEPGTAVSLECYAGAQDGEHGVKLEDEFFITDRGVVRLTRYPRDSYLTSR